MLKFIVILLVVPIVEIFLLIKIGSLAGVLPTILMLVLISSGGVWLVRHQGFGILRRIQLELSQGRIPAADVMDGALVLFGGILMVLPGFFTDVLAILFLVPASRVLIKQLIGLWLQRRMASNGVISIRGIRQ